MAIAAELWQESSAPAVIVRCEEFAPMTDKTPATLIKAKPIWLQASLIGFALIHLLALALPFAVGVSVKSVLLAVTLYWVRMWGITAGYHRYFAHRAYKTSRWFQFVLAWVGASSLQKGPLWWAGLHRTHHRWSDQPRDLHSPRQRGFWYSHAGWFIAPDHDGTDLALIPDFAKYPELRWIDRFHWVPFATLTVLCFAIDGWRGVVWGGFVSTVFGWHGTFFINSLAHVWGSRRYETTDTSRNNPILALITLGEGWHNNHHHYMNSANQGFFWWEVDVSYYTLRALALVGVVRDLRHPPAHILREKLVGAAEGAVQKIAGARASAELKLIEARTAVGHAVESAELRLSEARTSIEHAASEARTAVGTAVDQVTQAAETRLTEARTSLENAASEARDAVESAVESASQAVDATSAAKN